MLTQAGGFLLNLIKKNLGLRTVMDLMDLIINSCVDVNDYRTAKPGIGPDFSWLDAPP